MQDLNYEILDLGMVYYKNIIKNPQDLINKIENVKNNLYILLKKSFLNRQTLSKLNLINNSGGLT